MSTRIEEDYTREVEKIVEKMLAIGWDSKLKKHDGTSIVVSFTKAELCDLLLNIEETHHQQLQKAREQRSISMVQYVVLSDNQARKPRLWKVGN